MGNVRKTSGSFTIVYPLLRDAIHWSAAPDRSFAGSRFLIGLFLISSGVVVLVRYAPFTRRSVTDQVVSGLVVEIDEIIHGFT